MKNHLFLLLLIVSTAGFSQEKYTKGLPNGYAWIAPLSAGTPVFAKEESLLACLQERKYTELADPQKNKERFALSCDDYIDNLLNKGYTDSLKIDEISKEIDNFYENKENLIIPVLGAYCYCLQKITGVQYAYTEDYRKQLLEYSTKK